MTFDSVENAFRYVEVFWILHQLSENLAISECILWGKLIGPRIVQIFKCKSYLHILSYLWIFLLTITFSLPFVFPEGLLLVLVPIKENETPPRGGKRGGAWEHCSQKEMDGTIFGRRIGAKSTALVAICIKKRLFIASMQLNQWRIDSFSLLLIGNI